MPLRIGVLLSGCGVFDGSEIHEAVSVLIALDRAGAAASCMAPDIAQADVIDHLTRKPVAPGRRVLQESARIARGKIRDLATVTADELDGLILPGGFGAAKNLCDFASKGAAATVNEQVSRILTDMRRRRKPIGLACIAPVIAARVLGQMGLTPRVTIGTDRGTADSIANMGAEHRDTGPTDICIDEENRLVTTPCYMNDVGPWTVFQGAEKMVQAVLQMAAKRP